MHQFYKLFHEDCLSGMKAIPDHSVDLICTDLPYGTTQAKHDVIIPFEPLWAEYSRIIKENGAIVLFSDGWFTAQVMMSNPKLWRYNLIWDKQLTSGFLNANRQPLRQHEIISVFYKKQPTYNPQKVKGQPNHSKGTLKPAANHNYGKFDPVDNREVLGDMKHPTSILRFPKPHPSVAVHPTQKPVELLEFLIKSYTNEGDVVLDSCMGSGTTGVACMNTGRSFFGFESEKDFFTIAATRIEAASK